MVHIRWATYNARTLGALEAPQAMPVKGRRVRREDSENSAAQYVRASTRPRIFFPPFFSSLFSSLFSRRVFPPSPPSSSLRHDSLRLASPRFATALPTIGHRLRASNQESGSIRVSVDLSSLKGCILAETAPRITSTVRRPRDQADRQRDGTPGSVIAFNGPRKGPRNGGWDFAVSATVVLFAFARPSGFVSLLSARLNWLASGRCTASLLCFR